MPSTNKTEKLELNSWLATDRPIRNDFNADNLIIDSALGGHIENTSLHLTAQEKERASQPFTTVSYVGNGAAERTIDLSVQASAVIVYRAYVPFCVYDSAADYTKVYAAYGKSGASATAGLILLGSSLTVEQSNVAENGFAPCLNEQGAQYRVTVIK